MTEATLPSSGPHPRPRERTANPVLLLAGIGLFTLVAFLLGLVLGVHGHDILILGLALLTAFVGLMPMVADNVRPVAKRQLYITLVTLSFMAFLVMPVFTQYFLAPESDIGGLRLWKLDPQDIVNGQLAALVGFGCLLLGFYLPIGRVVSGFLPKATHEWSHEAALGLALFMIPLGWAVYLAGQFGLVPKRLGSGLLGVFASSIYFAIALLALIYLRYRSRPSLILIFICVPVTMAFNAFTGSKRAFLTPPVMVAIAYIVVERQLRVRWLAMGFAALVLLYPVAQFYRNVVQQGNTLNAAQILQDPSGALRQVSGFFRSTNPREYLTEGLASTFARLDSLGILCVIVRDTPERVPFQEGWSIGYVFLSYIPRVVWADKPTITAIGQWVTDNYGGGIGIKSNTGPSWMGEFYLNFGYPGIVVGMGLLGIFFRIIQEICFRTGAPIPAALAAVAAVYATARSPMSGLNRPINGIVFIVVPIMVAHVFVRMMSSPPRPQPEVE